jgi:hypothetical protein
VSYNEKEQKNEQGDISSPHSLKSINCKASEQFLHPRRCISRRHVLLYCAVSTSPRAVSVTLRKDLTVRVGSVSDVAYCRIRLLSYLQILPTPDSRVLPVLLSTSTGVIGVWLVSL